jgi:hypothetical protein
MILSREIVILNQKNSGNRSSSKKRQQEMSDEERQRQMDFILNNLPQVTAKIDGLADIQKADPVRIGRLEDAFVTLTKLQERVVDRLDERHHAH